MHRFRSGLPIIVALVLLGGACGDDDGVATGGAPPDSSTSTPEQPGTVERPTADDLAELAPNIACGDAVWTFSTPDDRMMVRVDIAGMLASLDGETSVDRIYDLADPSSGAVGSVEIGNLLGSSACNDAIDGAYELIDTRPATGGSARLEIAQVPDGPLEICSTPVDSVLTIDGVSFDVDGETVRTGVLTLESPIGWCPG